MDLDPRSVLLTDRVAVVTGAAVGIGAAIALAFARFGAHLALCDRDAENLAATARAVEAPGAASSPTSSTCATRRASAAFTPPSQRTFGRVDVLVNNAGGGFFAPFLELTPRGQDALVRENFLSVAHCVRAAVPLMPASGGSIVNVTSIEAHRAAPGYAIYAAMKAAVANLTRSLALELGERRIRVNCIAPDVIPTPGIGPLRETTPLRGAGTSTTWLAPRCIWPPTLALRDRHDAARGRWRPRGGRLASGRGWRIRALRGVL